MEEIDVGGVLADAGEDAAAVAILGVATTIWQRGARERKGAGAETKLRGRGMPSL
uniref:Uncharacterized protein n=1 Tax=Arundo donax TaxID=35708 RepID=A0A0A9FI58_ARUDO